jgi:hypothetical protein
MGKSSSRPKTFSEHKFLVHNSNASRINPLNQHFGMVPPQSHHPCSCAEVMQQARLAALNKTWFSSTTSLIWPATIFKKMTKTDGEIDNSHVK